MFRSCLFLNGGGGFTIACTPTRACSSHSREDARARGAKREMVDLARQNIRRNAAKCTRSGADDHGAGVLQCKTCETCAADVTRGQRPGPNGSYGGTIHAGDGCREYRKYARLACVWNIDRIRTNGCRTCAGIVGSLAGLVLIRQVCLSS